MELLETKLNREKIAEMSNRELDELCKELREFLIAHVSDCGGHLASNLGIVEATVAIHKVFDTSKDRLVFDVGHQCYVHKILTDRADGFAKLRKFGGLSGFPKPEESVHDAFIAGHASNSVSVALGMARARTLQKKDYHVIALIGDGALTGGLAYEGLNDAGASGEQMTVILNDNGMSIEKNVGAISRHLAQLRLKPRYFGLKKTYRRVVKTIPGGERLYRATHRVKSLFKRALLGSTFFEDIGFTYLGPVDGHNVNQIAYLLSVAKETEGPTLLHIVTQKGRGYDLAEQDPQNYHGVGHFDPEVGVLKPNDTKTYSDRFGQILCDLAEKDDKICAITAAMRHGTGLDAFEQKFPTRFFNVGIAEGHAVSLAGGLAAGGMIPVVAIYSTFLQRAFDMMIHDVALMHQHVVFAVDRAGLVGADGPTHHGVFDVGYLRQIPGMTVLSPVTDEEFCETMRFAVEDCTGPVAIRYPRGSMQAMETLPQFNDPDTAILCYGEMSALCTEAVKSLMQQGIRANLCRLVSLKPLNWERIHTAVGSARRVFVIEDCQDNGSVGQALAEGLSGRCEVICRNLGDAFTPFGDLGSLHRYVGIDAESICRLVREALVDNG